MGSRLTGVTFDIRLAGYLLSPNSTAYTVERLAGEYGAAPFILTGTGRRCRSWCGTACWRFR